MDKKKGEILSIVEKGTMDSKIITEAEKEIALKILEDLDGVLVIRAKSILEFCLKAIQYTSIKGMQYKKETAPEVPVQEQYEGNFNPYTGEKLHEICPNCWIKHKSYNCGYDECPGRKLIVQEAQGATHQE